MFLSVAISPSTWVSIVLLRSPCAIALVTIAIERNISRSRPKRRASSSQRSFCLMTRVRDASASISASRSGSSDPTFSTLSRRILSATCCVRSRSSFCGITMLRLGSANGTNRAERREVKDARWSARPSQSSC